MRRIAALSALCLLSALCAAGAMAEPREFTYGGSGEDFLMYIAAGEDGRIALTGYTDSTDGTLAGREEAGRCGWLLCVNAQGNPVFTWWLPGAIPHALERTQNGFAAAVSGGVTASGLRQTYLALFDEAGIQTGRVPLGAGTGYCQTAALPDGGIAALVPFISGEGKEPVDLDARLVIVEPEDLH